MSIQTASIQTSDKPLGRDDLARLVARDIKPGSFVNLGIGQPTLVSNYLQPEQNITLHTENGMLGMGPEATGDQIDGDLINAGKIPVTELPGASYFHHADSFAIMRGGHLDICVLGAFQVSATGDLANWHTGAPDAIPAVGGAMDLATGAKDVFVMMTLLTRDGASKIVEACTYPLTGVGCVTRVYTDRAVFLTGPDVIEAYRIEQCLGERPRPASLPCSQGLGQRLRIGGMHGNRHSRLPVVVWLPGWWFSLGDYTTPGGPCEFLRVCWNGGKGIDWLQRVA